MTELLSNKILTRADDLSWKGDNMLTGWATGVGGVTMISHFGSLATTILTWFPQFRKTWATCSVLIPCTFVLPISKMWSPVLSLPSLKKIIKYFASFNSSEFCSARLNNVAPRVILKIVQYEALRFFLKAVVKPVQSISRYSCLGGTSKFIRKKPVLLLLGNYSCKPLYFGNFYF